jgi:acetoacetyl-CoA synthetase
MRDITLWSPSSDFFSTTRMRMFLDYLQTTEGISFSSYEPFHKWSLQNIEKFWKAVWGFCDIKGNLGPGPFLEKERDIKNAVFFPSSTLNFAENLLRKKTNEIGIVFWGEDQVKRSLTFTDLHDQVSSLIQVFKKRGLKKGDRVAGLVPNTPEAIIAMLATTALGGIWASCSPDFGIPGILDRFHQIEPKLLIVADYYLYRGKQHKITEKLSTIQKGLPSLQDTIVFSYKGSKETQSIPHTLCWNSLLESHPPQEIVFERFPFNTPLFIMFSSGTTGIPKCIIHGAGGTLLQHLKEHQLHCDVRPQDRVFYFTTCGWMMWNWQVSALASGATLLLYDGSPAWPDENILFDYAQYEKMTLFGTSAKYLAALQNAGISPKNTHNLKTLRVITSTGSPLPPEGFDYVYHHIKGDVLLASISGGTDIISCFVLGTPLKPVYRGEIQAAGLGMNVQVFDEEGISIKQEKGELVCTQPFPSRPLGFWNDSDGCKYHEAYFDKFKNIWCHGDFAEITEHNGFIIHGRSDTVLNRGGIRIGTAEIYRQVEQLEEVLESIVVGQPYEGDVRILLFVKLKGSYQLDDLLTGKIKHHIRINTTPRHVPDLIIQVPDIPRTKNGKLVELAVGRALQGLPIKNIEALANPESLEFFHHLFSQNTKTHTQ